MTTAPLFLSVVIPTYRRPESLKSALQSVFLQTVQELEIIVVVDGGTDEPVWSEGSDSVRVVRHAVNRGVSAARNTGARYARGEFVSFLDDDDSWEPRFVEATRDALRRNPDAAFSWCGVNRVRTDGTNIYRTVWRPTSRRTAYLEYLQHRRVGLHGLTVKRDALDSVGGFKEDLKTGEDIEFVARLFRSYPYALVDGFLANFTQHAGPRLSNSEVNLRAQIEIFECHRDAIEAHAHVAASTFARLARAQYLMGEAKSARGTIWKALRRSPVQVDVWKIFLKNEFRHIARGVGRDEW